MVFFVGMPILIGIGNYMVPLMIGPATWPSLRLNALGFWATLFGGLLVYSSFATRGRPGARLVRLRSVDRDDVFPRGRRPTSGPSA